MMRALLILAACAAAPASAHVTIWPKESTAGAREKYDVRVPDEKTVDTVALELRFPRGLKLSAIEQKPGWRYELIRDQSGAILGVRWSGKLAPMEFTQFGLLATNPPDAGVIAWDATQFFADGTKIEWNGTDGPSTPAPRVRLVAPVKK